jgi:hypothetical protein
METTDGGGGGAWVRPPPPSGAPPLQFVPGACAAGLELGPPAAFLGPLLSRKQRGRDGAKTPFRQHLTPHWTHTARLRLLGRAREWGGGTEREGERTKKDTADSDRGASAGSGQTVGGSEMGARGFDTVGRDEKRAAPSGAANVDGCLPKAGGGARAAAVWLFNVVVCVCEDVYEDVVSVASGTPAGESNA